MSARITVENAVIERPSVVEGKMRLVRILSAVSFVVPAGGRLAIFGPSGAGKTSLLRVLNRLDDVAAGRILLDDVDIHTLDPTALRRRVGMVFQQPFLFDRTVAENIGYPLRLMNRLLPDEQAVSLLEEVGLPADFLTRRAQQLSGGQQQRVAVARALVLEPEVLLLDEPTSALDEESAHALMDALLRRNHERGLTLIMVTHARENLYRLASPAMIVHGGQIAIYPDADAALNVAAREQVKLE